VPTGTAVLVCVSGMGAILGMKVSRQAGQKVLIAATTTKTGLKVESALDTRVYRKGIKISDANMKRRDIRGDAFHPERNYAVIPRWPTS